MTKYLRWFLRQLTSNGRSGTVKSGGCSSVGFLLSCLCLVIASQVSAAWWLIPIGVPLMIGFLCIGAIWGWNYAKAAQLTRVVLDRNKNAFELSRGGSSSFKCGGLENVIGVVFYSREVWQHSQHGGRWVLVREPALLTRELRLIVIDDYPDDDNPLDICEDLEVMNGWLGVAPHLDPLGLEHTGEAKHENFKLKHQLANDFKVVLPVKDAQYWFKVPTSLFPVLEVNVVSIVSVDKKFSGKFLEVVVQYNGLRQPTSLTEGITAPNHAGSGHQWALQYGDRDSTNCQVLVEVRDPDAGMFSATKKADSDVVVNFGQTTKTGVNGSHGNFTVELRVALHTGGTEAAEEI
eukprot:TRINITY_DN52502_c0_g1_i1.p1 TRINITY_DN52502_c0_g1~~TRINITY_DN52502_c0_g1_i1.p1  ORF type:complete len:349 (-),score=26.57 TRINITY_DN52502_c0_g1_i1:869-1915(-)